MDDTDLKILAAVQDEFPLVSSPFLALGEKLGLGEDEVISRLEKLEIDGLVRRLGPILDIRKLGLSGVLVAVKVSEEEAQGVARYCGPVRRGLSQLPATERLWL